MLVSWRESGHSLGFQRTKRYELPPVGHVTPPILPLQLQPGVEERADERQHMFKQVRVVGSRRSRRSSKIVQYSQLFCFIDDSSEEFHVSLCLNHSSKIIQTQSFGECGDFKNKRAARG